MIVTFVCICINERREKLQQFGMVHCPSPYVVGRKDIKGAVYYRIGVGTGPLSRLIWQCFDKAFVVPLRLRRVGQGTCPL